MSSTQMQPLRRSVIRPPFSQALSSLFLAVDRSLDLWQRRRENRRQLSRLSDHLLRDIGLTEAEAHHEAEKPFWRA